MATCGGWYYTKPAWHKDPLTAVTGTSGMDTLGALKGLSEKTSDAKILLAYLTELRKNNERNPFGCAEPHAVCQLLEKGAELNQIFIGATFESAYSNYWKQDVDRFLKPCVNCQKWLTARLKDGSYMIDMGELNKFVRDSHLSWWG